MTFKYARHGWVAALCVATWLGGCSDGPPPISLVEDDAGPPTPSVDSGRPDAWVDLEHDAGPGPTCDGCTVAGVCYRAGAADPSNPCAVCDPSRSVSAFSDNDGASCDDGAYCTVGDRCSAGACVGGEPRTCSDSIECTSGDHCDEALDACLPTGTTCAADEVCDLASGACSGTCAGCAIDGLCVPEGTRNPVNPCEICRAASSATGWSANDGGRCDDGLFCTVGDTCSGRVCEGSARDCADGVACDGTETCDETADRCQAGTSTCTGGDVCVPESDRCESTCLGCSVGGTCWAAGDRNPANPCEICDPSLSRASWSANDGASCDDGEFCTQNDVCSAGVCSGAARSCSDGIACTGLEYCNEAADACERGPDVCAEGTFCDASSDSCVSGACTGCSIAGVCYESGTRNPLNPCEICNVAVSTDNWAADDGASCEDGDFCTVSDVCEGHACVAGVARTCDDGVACNGTEACDEDLNLCASGTSTCAPDEECSLESGACEACAGCVIGGVCYVDGARNPMSQCERCEVATSATSWTASADSTACDDGDFCTTADVCSAGVCGGEAVSCDDGVACNGVEVCSLGTCVAGSSTCGSHEMCDPGTDSCVGSCSGCIIDDVCYAVGAGNPANPCEICGGAGETAWSADFGTSCDDGDLCTTGDVCGVAGCAGEAVSCDDGIACNGVESCAVGVCVDGSIACGAGQSCDESADTCVCNGCTIGGTCYADGAANPANPCEMCQVGESDSSWSAVSGAVCDDGDACTTADSCSAGVCAGTAVSCDDGVSCNGVESCSPSSGLCEAGTSTCDPTFSCDEGLDACTCDGCAIDGVCYPVGAPNPADGCESCAALGDTAWSGCPADSTCDVGTSTCVPL